jgi:glycosyltransferase involved in cell wall biosynthesis
LIINVLRNPQSAIRNPQSAIRNPQSTIAMNVLWLPSWYPSVHYPTYGCFVQKQAEAVCQHDATIQIAILYVLRANVPKVETEVIQKDNLLEIKLFYPEKASFLGMKKMAYGWHYWRAYQKGMSILKQFDFKPDVLHLHVVYGAGLYALWLKFWTRLPLLISEHWSGYEQGEYQKAAFLHKKIFQYCFQKAAVSICISSKMNDNLHQNGLFAKQTVIIPNVVHTNLFHPTLNQVNRNTRKIKFIHVSNFYNEIKNTKGIIRAIQKLVEINTNFSFEMVGDSSERLVLEQMVSDLNLKPFVYFKGLLSPMAVAQHMRQADVFVLFSNYEGLPCVILEALAAGLPVIATETGGIHEWITPETGILIEVGDENALLAAMQTMMTEHLNYDKTILRQQIVDKASYQAVGKAIVDVYKSRTDGDIKY